MRANHLTQSLQAVAHDREMLSELEPKNNKYDGAESIMAAYREEDWDAYLDDVDRGHYSAMAVLNSIYIANRLKELGYYSAEERAGFLETLGDLEPFPMEYLDALDYLKTHIRERNLSLEEFRQYVKERSKHHESN